jgi:uncharacterized protein involved in exopolysaccharide biosynthesis
VPEKKRNPYNFLFDVDFRKYYEILIKQKGFILVFCFSAILTSLALTYVFSEKYIAGANIYYRPLERSLLRQKGIEAFGAPVPSAPFKVIIQTLQDMIRSDTILRPVVETLDLDKKVEVEYSTWYKRWYHHSKDFVKKQLSNFWNLLKYGRIIKVDATVGAIKGLRKSISIQATKDSYVYILSVKDKYPKRAAIIVDTAGQYLVDWLKEQDQNPAQHRCIQLDKQLQEVEKKIKELRKEREDLLKQGNFIAVAEERSEGVRNLYAMEREAIRFKAQSEEKRKKLRELEREIQNKSATHVSPDDAKKMESDRLSTQIELQGLLAKIDFQQSSIVELRTKLQKLPSLKTKVDDLDMQIVAATRGHLHLKDLHIEALSQASSAESEIKVLHPASIPAIPVQPIKIYHVGLTGILSLFFSTGLIYVLAFFNIRTFFSSDGVKGRRATEGITQGESSSDE